MTTLHYRYTDIITEERYQSLPKEDRLAFESYIMNKQHDVLTLRENVRTLLNTIPNKSWKRHEPHNALERNTLPFSSIKADTDHFLLSFHENEISGFYPKAPNGINAERHPEHPSLITEDKKILIVTEKSKHDHLVGNIQAYKKHIIRYLLQDPNFSEDVNLTNDIFDAITQTERHAFRYYSHNLEEEFHTNYETQQCQSAIEGEEQTYNRLNQELNHIKRCDTEGNRSKDLYTFLKNYKPIKSFKAINDTLILETQPLTAINTHQKGDRIALGRMRITIPLSNNRRSPGYIEIRTLSALYKTTSRETRIQHIDYERNAPHCRNRACFGNVESNLEILMRDQEYTTLIMLVIDYIQTYNSGDVWGESYSSWPKYERDHKDLWNRLPATEKPCTIPT